MLISEEIIAEAIDRLVETANPRRVYLFGSYARGDARDESDLDFLVVEKSVESRRREMVRLHDSIRSMRTLTRLIVSSLRTSTSPLGDNGTSTPEPEGNVTNVSSTEPDCKATRRKLSNAVESMCLLNNRRRCNFK